MSPLTPLENGSQSFNENGIKQGNLIERGPSSKVTYSMDALYGMRHTESRAPNLGNRSVLALISRNNFVPSMHVPGAFSQNITASTMDRFQRDRRQLNFNRSATVTRHYRNGNSDGQTNYRDFNGERLRQPNHGKLNITYRVIIFFSFRLCSSSYKLTLVV